MKGKITESVSVLKELLGRVPVVEEIKITDQSEQDFTVILKERGNGSVRIHAICLNRTVSRETYVHSTSECTSKTAG